MLPPRPDDAVPVPMYTAPLLPDAAVPEPMLTEPLVPLLADPVLSTSDPDTPAVPALAVWTSMLPLLVAELYPLVKITSPPAALDDVPADTTTWPPVPLLPLPTVI